MSLSKSLFNNLRARVTLKGNFGVAVKPTIRTLTTNLTNSNRVAWSQRGALFNKQIGSMNQMRTLFIQTEVTPNQDSLKFIPGVPVMGQNGTAEFLNLRDAMNSNLAKKLLNIEGIRSVFFGPDFITITKDTDSPWQLMKPDIYGSITDFVDSGEPILYDENNISDTTILPDDSESVQMIKELLDTRIRPSIQEDGGDIEYRGFDEGVVKLKLKGACRTCDSSVITLKNGIENMLMHYIPEVTAVEQVLDEEEMIAQQEFEKLEKKLAEKKKN
ncbi:hypothetical protein K7432_015371 [Basidiobolus ranarum]|uniref:Scaffold protein Nfu/NifU N-terminal domain-containing protein n=1 Tax=Basidiobolus ranarum TaxID=34480 RepID=A0ABR2VP81_9FUNG